MSFFNGIEGPSNAGMGKIMSVKVSASSVE